MHETSYPAPQLDGIRAVAVAPDDGAVFALGEALPPPLEGDRDEDAEDDLPSGPAGAVLRLDPTPELLATGRARAVDAIAGAGFVVLVEETAERYVWGASILDRADGSIGALSLGEAVGRRGAALEDGAVLLAGDRGIFRVDGPGRARQLLRGGMHEARVGMLGDIVVVGDAIVWSTVGDTTAPSQIHRAPLAGGDATIVLRGAEGERFGHLAVHGDEVLVERYLQDVRANVLRSELWALGHTGAPHALARLEPVALRALAVVGNAAWALPLAIGAQAHHRGFRRIDLATGEVTTPTSLADEAPFAMTADARSLYFTLRGEVRRVEVVPRLRVG